MTESTATVYDFVSCPCCRGCRIIPATDAGDFDIDCPVCSAPPDAYVPGACNVHQCPHCDRRYAYADEVDRCPCEVEMPGTCVACGKVHYSKFSAATCTHEPSQGTEPPATYEGDCLCEDVEEPDWPMEEEDGRLLI